MNNPLVDSSDRDRGEFIRWRLDWLEDSFLLDARLGRIGDRER